MWSVGETEGSDKKKITVDFMSLLKLIHERNPRSKSERVQRVCEGALNDHHALDMEFCTTPTRRLTSRVLCV
jgi:hypothetical protein